MKDVTNHNPEAHTAHQIPKHTKDWYDVWGGRCPQCHAVAEFENE